MKCPVLILTGATGLLGAPVGLGVLPAAADTAPPGSSNPPISLTRQLRPREQSFRME